jgi:hypothetical protein
MYNLIALALSFGLILLAARQWDRLAASVSLF